MRTESQAAVAIRVISRFLVSDSLALGVTAVDGNGVNVKDTESIWGYLWKK
jgi:hypothetical protein